jgi:hypothetical protein
MHETLVNMFTLQLPLLEKILRPILVYIFLIVGIRLSGKRELAQLNPFDLIVLLTRIRCKTRSSEMTTALPAE